MIVNLPASHGGNALLTMDASQGQCDYNFLKRKLDAEDTHPINNEEGNITLASYQGAASPNDNAWKKRYVVHDSSTSSNNTANCYIANNFNSNPLTEFRNGSEQGMALNSSSAADMTFNLIGSSSFINDLFAYDANLIVPVSASFVSLSPICGSESTAISPASIAPTSVCVNPSYDDGSSWQATDLLELDHRYNSGLQTDITDLNPTVTLKHTQSVQLMSPTQSQPESARQQQSSSPMDFLVPSTQKQVFRPQSNKYRQQLQPPPHLSSDNESDLEDKNLSWLLNFKFDELPHLSPDVGANNTTANSALSAANASNNNTFSPLSSNKSDSSSPASACTAASNTHLSQSERSCSPKTCNKVGRKFEELVMEVTSEVDSADMIVPENVVVEDSSSRASKKPPFTYTELIEYALEDKGELTVSGIYQWISDRFPFYKSNDDRWKNSVRHNLSINPHFRKGVKAPQGAGHLWTISSGDSAENVLAWEHKKQRLDLFFKMESMNRERLQQHQLQLQQQQQQQQCVSPQQQRANGQDCPPEQCGYDEAAIAAANITREMLSASTTHNALNCTHNESAQKSSIRDVVHELPFNDIMSDEELRKTAGQILNGIHREVEVQSVNSISTYQDALLDSEDYLNPIHKDVAVRESGLRNTLHSHLQPHVHFHSHGSSSSSQYYVTEIDPLELGIQMTHQEAEVEQETEEVLFSDEFNLNYFSCNAGSDIVA